MTPDTFELLKTLIGAAGTLGAGRMVASALKKRIDHVETVQEQHAAELAKHRMQLAEHDAHHAASDERLDTLESAQGLVR